MQKSPSLLLAAILTFLACQLVAQSVIRLEPSRSPVAEGKFKENLRSYAVGSIDAAQVTALLRSQDHFDTLTIHAGGDTFQVELSANDVKSPNFKLRIATDSGIEEQTGLPNYTWAGTTIEGGHDVRITAADNFFSAMISLGQDEIYIEPARNLDADASVDQFVMFRSSDIIHTMEGSFCAMVEREIKKQDKPKQNGERGFNCNLIDIAIANDYGMFQRHGSAQAVMIYDLAILNLVDRYYNYVFTYAVSHKVVEVFIPTSVGSDPFYTGSVFLDLLINFRNWAITGFTSQHDVGSLWTSRNGGGVLGIAWGSGICSDSFCYNVNTDYNWNYTAMQALQAHELGHNYGYVHDPVGTNFIMSPSVSDPPSTTWSPASVVAISDAILDLTCSDECPAPVFANVGIGNTNPHPSAILELRSTTKGFLVPRLTAIQRENILYPAQGLLVFDITSNSFWVCKSPGVWSEIFDNSNSLVKEHLNNTLLGTNGNVGIGVGEPKNKLDIANGPRYNPWAHPTDRPLYVTGDIDPEANGVEVRLFYGYYGVGIGSQSIYAASYYDNHDLGLVAKGPLGSLYFKTNAIERMRVTGDGNIGIGISTPNAPLQFAPVTANRKVVLYEAYNNDHQYYGFGVNGGTLRYQTEAPYADHVFFSAIDATQSRELMRVGGSGTVSINNTMPDASAILDVKSTSKGVLVPRMTTPQRTAIAAPATGLLVFDITTNSFWFRGTTAWVELIDNLDQELFRNGPDKIYAGLTDSVGIGTINPEFKLDVRTAGNQEGIAHSNGTIKLATKLNTGGEIGTVTNHSLYLRANNGTNQFQLTPTGNVGINLADPTHRLDVATGTARTGTHAAAGMAMYVTGSLTDAGNGFEIRDFNGTQGVGIGRNTVYASGSQADVDLSTSAKGTNGNLRFNTNGAERARINGAGNMGIGITNPTHKVDILSGPARTLTHAAPGMAMYITGALTDAGNGFEIRDFNGNQGIGIGRNTIYAAGNWADVDLSIAAKGFTSGSVRIVTNNLERLRVSTTGNVGIGVAAPHALVHLSSTTSNRKIVLSETVDNDNQFFGLGRNTGILRYQTDATTSDHVFYAATSATTSNELLRIKGGGNVTIAGIIESEPVIEPTMINGFSQYGFGYGSVAFYKDKEGIVRLRGLANVPMNPNGVIMFTLPVGYRPTSGQRVFTAYSSEGTIRLDVFPNGNVMYNAAAGMWVSLEGIAFRAD